jgi:hypothetical protein
MELLQPLPTIIGNPTATRALIRSIFPHSYDHLGSVATNELALSFAHQVGRLMGPSYAAPDGSANGADFVTLGIMLAMQRAFGIANLGEAFPDSPTTLLDEWEAMLGLPSGVGLLTDDARRTRLLAQWRTRFAGTPQAIERAIAPVNGGSLPSILERVAADCTAAPEKVFGFVVKIQDTTRTDPAAMAIVNHVLDVMKPAHTNYWITSTQSSGFLTDDPNSLTDNTVIAH